MYKLRENYDGYLINLLFLSLIYIKIHTYSLATNWLTSWTPVFMPADSSHGQMEHQFSKAFQNSMLTGGKDTIVCGLLLLSEERVT